MKSRQLILCCILAVMLSSTGWARIGETLKQCVERYGEVKPLYLDITLLDYPQSTGRDRKPVTHTRDGFVQYGFEKAGIMIGAAFYDGKAAFMAFWKVSDDEPRSSRTPSLTRTEIETILSANKAGSTWETFHDKGSFTFLRTADRKLIADHNRWRKVLRIKTKQIDSIIGVLQKRKEMKSLQGF